MRSKLTVAIAAVTVALTACAAVARDERHLGKAILEAFSGDGVDLDLPPRVSKPRGFGS